MIVTGLLVVTALLVVNVGVTVIATAKRYLKTRQSVMQGHLRGVKVPPLLIWGREVTRPIEAIKTQNVRKRLLKDILWRR